MLYVTDSGIEVTTGILKFTSENVIFQQITFFGEIFDINIIVYYLLVLVSNSKFTFFSIYFA